MTVQVASVWDLGKWTVAAEDRLRLFLLLQRWLWRHGGGLLQLECSTSFTPTVRWHAVCIHWTF